MYHIGTQEKSADQGHADAIAIRLAGSGDDAALRRLAELDSASVPAGRLLVAVIAGEPRAAVSVSTGQAIADPFHPTAGIVRLLDQRAAQLRGPAGWRARLGLRRRTARPRGALSPQPAGTIRAFD
jgi:hypothetical protein